MLGSPVNCILLFGSIEKNISMLNCNKVIHTRKFQNNKITSTLTSRALLWLTYMCSKQNISERYWLLIKHVSQQGANTCTSAYKISVSSVHRREVTDCCTSRVCFKSLAFQPFLKVSKEVEIFSPTCCKPDLRLVPALRLWSVGPVSFPTLWTPFRRAYLVSDLQQPPTWSKL